MKFESELEKQLVSERDNEVKRFSYDNEIKYYSMIASGDVEGVTTYLNNYRNQDKTTRKGILSSDKLTNEKYHVIIMTALISRFCIEAGLDIAVSYSMSDIFIRYVDKAQSLDEVEELFHKIALEYTSRMRDLSRSNVVSRYVVLAIDYIRDHIQETLTVDQVASALAVNASYLSKLFKHDMGKSISSYIRDSKIEIAKNMLRHLDESSLEIASYLGFSSQSHFIQVFKKETGLTPEEYRKQHYHKSWIGETSEDKE